MYRKIWDRSIEAAERNNKPGVFTAFNGFEWTQSIKGNNLHRIVVFRDGPDRTKQVMPFSEFDGTDPEDLWKYMADYEAEDRRARAWPSRTTATSRAGRCSPPRPGRGKPFDQGIRRDCGPASSRLVEVSQSKGDSETTPQLSPNDPFANFERWNKANIFGMIATTPEMLPFNYVRSALKLGLEHEAKLGVNPFKFGLIGGSDTHTSLSTTRAENYFGVGTIAEPKPERWKEFFLKSPVSPKLDTYMWEMAPGGLGGVWARENTREAIWDAMNRREIYCTSGTRPTVRVFGGWDFTAKDLGNPEPVWVEQGYARGVPMGGDLTNPPKGKAPTFMIKALCDPDGAYLDRVQIIKGWLDGKGVTHEKVIDVAWSGDRKPDPKTGTGAVGRQHGGRQERDLDEHDRRPALDRLLAGPGLRPGPACLLLRARDRDPHAALDRLRRQALRRQDGRLGPHDGDQPRLHVTDLVQPSEMTRATLEYAVPNGTKLGRKLFRCFALSEDVSGWLRRWYSWGRLLTARGSIRPGRSGTSRSFELHRSVHRLGHLRRNHATRRRCQRQRRTIAELAHQVIVCVLSLEFLERVGGPQTPRAGVDEVHPGGRPAVPSNPVEHDHVEERSHDSLHDGQRASVAPHLRIPVAQARKRMPNRDHSTAPGVGLQFAVWKPLLLIVQIEVADHLRPTRRVFGYQNRGPPRSLGRRVGLAVAPAHHDRAHGRPAIPGPRLRDDGHAAGHPERQRGLDFSA